MNKNRSIALIITFLGSILIIGSGYAARYLAGVRENLHGLSNVIGSNPVSGMLQSEASKKLADYQMIISLCFWAGIVLALAGVLALIFTRKKK
jgi:hypothetical protein